MSNQLNIKHERAELISSKDMVGNVPKKSPVLAAPPPWVKLIVSTILGPIISGAIVAYVVSTSTLQAQFMVDSAWATVDGRADDLRWVRENVNSEKPQTRNFQSVDLQGKNLAGLDLEGANFKDAIFDAANLKDANLRGTDLTNASLVGAILEGADLRGADLTNASLVGAILEGADLRGADLTNASLVGAILEGADLRGADLTGVASLSLSVQFYGCHEASNLGEKESWNTRIYELAERALISGKALVSPCSLSELAGTGGK